MKKLDDWEDKSEDEELNEQSDDNKEEVPQQEIKKEPKKKLLKDEHGEIIINKLDTYIEPVKQVKEARGDTSINILSSDFFNIFFIKNLI